MQEEYQKVILVVDDDDIYRTRLCRAFAERGWKVLGAPDGPTALRLAAESDPDLVVVDLRLAGMGGLDIVRELRRLNQEACIIMLTGHGGSVENTGSRRPAAAFQKALGIGGLNAQHGSRRAK